MGIVENIKFLCNQHSVSIPKLGTELGFGNGAIYNWDKSSPSIDKVQKIADYFGETTDFIIFGFDKELERLIRELSEVNNGKLYFPEEVAKRITDKIEPLKKEYYDVPLDLEPLELIGLLGNFPLSTDFKKELLNILNEVKASITPIKNNEVETIAAHHDGDDWTEEELEDIEQFKEFIRMRREKRNKG
ncbi:helix-turn-helix domain-containing protein [Paenibacillus solani]|uniref:helix-turn-helix domain-containing protein n=1 Tax=Paenibacillus solani TaxID=1705565 RepID=UPI003D2826F8